MKTIILDKFGVVKEVNIKRITKKLDNYDLIKIFDEMVKSKKIRVKGQGKPSILYIFNEDLYDLYIVGWKNGNHENINKHELPPPIDNELFYGDLSIIKIINKKMFEFSKEQYNIFYEKTFGGFEDIEHNIKYDSDEYFSSTEEYIPSDESSSDSSFEYYQGSDDLSLNF